MGEKPRPLRPCKEDLAFFGRIGADVSHDMRNVLSIVAENAGLLDDQLALAESGKTLDREKLKKLSARITRQVARGTQTMEWFSRFAHAADEADEEAASSDLTAITETMAALAERHVVLAGCKLEADLPDEAIRVKANPFSLQHAVFSAIELILESLENGQVVTIKLAGRGATAVMSVSGSAAGAGELSGRISRLSAVINELEGSVETSWEEGVLSLILTVPAD